MNENSVQTVDVAAEAVTKGSELDIPMELRREADTSVKVQIAEDLNEEVLN